MAAPVYEYSALRQACSRGGVNKELCNLAVTVDEIGLPRATRGMDKLVNLRVMDLVGDQDTDAVELLVFARQERDLPRPRQEKDILLLYDVAAGTHMQKAQLTANTTPLPPGHKHQAHPSRPHTRFSLFRHDSNSLEPYQSNCPDAGRVEPGSLEAKLLGAFRRTCALLAPLGEQLDLSGPVPRRVFVDSFQHSVHDLIPGVSCNVSGRVLSVEEVQLGRYRAVVYLWDGTDAKPLPPDLWQGPWQARSDAECAGLRPLHLPLFAREGALVVSDSGEAAPGGRHGADKIDFQRSFSPPFQHCSQCAVLPERGTALPVLLGPQLRPPAAGAWVKFRHIGMQAVGGQLQAFAAARTTWAPRPQDAVGALRAYEARTRAEVACDWVDPSGCGLLARWSPPRAVREIRPERLTSLRAVLLDAPDPRPRLYRALVLVRAAAPEARECCPAVPDGVWEGREEGLRQPTCLLPEPGTARAFALRLCLADPTAELQALLAGKSAQAMLGSGHPVADLAVDAGACDRLESTLRLLQEGAYLEAGLLSVCAGPDKQRLYFVVHTEIDFAALRRSQVGGR